MPKEGLVVFTRNVLLRCCCVREVTRPELPSFKGFVVVVETGFLVDLRGSAFYTLPVPGQPLGKPGVGSFKAVVDVGEVEAMGQGQEGLIDFATAYNEALLLTRGRLEGGLRGGGHVAAGQLQTGVTCEYNVLTLGQGPFGQGRKGLTTHHDGLSGGELFEAPEIAADVGQLVAPAPDGQVLIDDCYEGYLHGWGFIRQHCL